jgi:adenylate kinase
MSASAVASETRTEPAAMVLMGAPGSGKGTQALRLATALGVPHIATGDIIRAEMAQETALGQSAREYYDRGDLVPDDVVIGIIRERVAQPDCAGGFIMDGFPRTLAQARALDAALAEVGRTVSRVIYLAVPEDELMRRLQTRWTCTNCGRTYNSETNRPRTEGVCDFCGARLSQRADDGEATARRRIQVYTDETAPLLDFYRRRDQLLEIPAVGSIDDVEATLRRRLEEAS